MNTPDTATVRPRIAFHINMVNLLRLPDWSAGPRGELSDVYAAVKAAGYEGLQAYGPDEAALDAGLLMSGMARVLDPAALDALAAQHKAWGFVATTLHLGTGLETDAEADRLAGAVLEAQARHAYPLFAETHRATLTQDMRRTLDLAARFPALRFNADLSHWYTGQEMTYGDFDAKMEALAPVLARVGFLHGRIGDSCAMQTPIHDAVGVERPSVAHFRALWARCCAGFLARATPGETLVFAPELLPNVIEHGGRTYPVNYARLLPDGREETDRWTEALTLNRIAAECFAAAGGRATDDPH